MSVEHVHTPPAALLSDASNASLISRRAMLLGSAAAVLTACARRACGTNCAQGVAPHSLASLASRLGYAPDSRLIIFNADDIGLAHSINDAVMAAFERGFVDSGSVMVVCEWFPEFASWARGRKALDIGVHLTITTGQVPRWGPVLGAARVPSLVDSDGYFPEQWPTDRPVNTDELEAEMRAQIQRAINAGLDLTHLDAHQHLLQLRGARVFDVLRRLAREYRLPFRLARSWVQRAPYLLDRTADITVPLERLISISPGNATPAEWSTWYANRVREIPPGLSELFVHVGHDTPELEAVFKDHPNWGSEWRQRDLQAIESAEMRAVLHSSGAIRIGWRQVRDALRAG